MHSSFIKIHDAIIQNLIPSQDFIFGYADLHGLIDKKFEGFLYGISIGKRLDDRIVDDLANGPTLEYFNHYHRINNELTNLTQKIHACLQGISVNSILIKPTMLTGSVDYKKYLKTLTADISHKMVATRAGLGWIGKTDLFISKEFGPRLRLVSILIDQDPGVNSIPVEESMCGKCNLCVAKCPAQAANGKSWNIRVHRDEFFNANKCREKCGELAKQRLNVDERICGICVHICPMGKRKQKSACRTI